MMVSYKVYMACPVFLLQGDQIRFFFTFKKLIQVNLDHPVLCRIPLKTPFPMIDSTFMKIQVILLKNSKPSLEVVAVKMMIP